MKESPNMYFWCEKMMFSNYKRMKIVLSSYFKACDLFDVVEEKLSNRLPKTIREKKQEKEIGVLKKAIHSEVWTYIGDSRTPSCLESD